MRKIRKPLEMDKNRWNNQTNSFRSDGVTSKELGYYGTRGRVKTRHGRHNETEGQLLGKGHGRVSRVQVRHSDLKLTVRNLRDKLMRDGVIHDSKIRVGVGGDGTRR